MVVAFGFFGAEKLTNDSFTNLQRLIKLKLGSAKRDVLKILNALNVGMHDIYRTDKLSTNMGENDVIFIAPINK